MTKGEILNHLKCNEPDYKEIRKWDNSALSILNKIANQEDDITSSKAIYAIALVGGDQAISLLEKFKSDTRYLIRLSVAGACRFLNTKDSDLILSSLLDDGEDQIKYVAIGSTQKSSGRQIVEKVRKMSKNRDNKSLSNFAKERLKIF